MKHIYYYIFSVFDAKCVQKQQQQQQKHVKRTGGENYIKSVNMKLFKSNLRLATTQHFTLSHHLFNKTKLQCRISV